MNPWPSLTSANFSEDPPEQSGAEQNTTHSRHDGSESEGNTAQGLTLGRFGHALSFDSAALRSEKTFSSSNASEHSNVVRALRRLRRCTDSLDSDSASSTSKIRWIEEAADEICAKPSGLARRSAFEEKSRQLNRIDYSVEAARRVVNMFYRNGNNLGRNNPVRILRAMIDLEHWFSCIEQMLQGLIILHRQGPTVSSDCVVRMMAYVMDPAPVITLPERLMDESTHDIVGDMHTSQRVHTAARTLQYRADKFLIESSALISTWIGARLYGADLNFLRARIYVLPKGQVSLDSDSEPDEFDFVPRGTVDMGFVENNENVMHL
jgi:hypothetical protein